MIYDINFIIKINAINHFLKNCAKSKYDTFYEIEGVIT